jgi:hypothetical protein
LNLLLSDRWLDEDELALRRARQFVAVDLEVARRSPTRGHRNALDVGAHLVVQAFTNRGLTVTASERGAAVGVLRLICERARLFVGIKSHQAAIRKTQR